jgi:hypothetical protein
MEQRNVATVGELGADLLVEFGPRLGVVLLPPGG